MELSYNVMLVLLCTCGFFSDAAGSFCGSDDSPVLQVCRNNQTTGGDAYIYVDPSGGLSSAYCRCIIYTTNQSSSGNVLVSSTKGYGSGISFTILNSVFISTEDTKKNITVTSSPKTIIFKKTVSRRNATMCLRFLSSEFKKFTIKCHHNDTETFSHSVGVTAPSSTKGIKDSSFTSVRTLGESIVDDKKSTLNLGLVIGSVSATVIVLTVIVVIVLCRRKSRQTAKEPSVEPQPTEEETGHYFLEDNERYVSADDCKQTDQQNEEQRLLKPHETQSNDTYDQIGVENKPRQSNNTHLGEGTSKKLDEDASLYNQVNSDVETKGSTDNVYNTKCNEDTYNHLDDVLSNKNPVENIYNEASGKV